MKKILLLCCLVLVSLGYIFAFGSGVVGVPAAKGVLIPIGDEVYALMDDLFVLTGSSVPSSSRPWTVSEALNEISRIDSSLLSSNEKILYDSISARLCGDSDTWVSLKFEVSPETYIHTNGDSYDREEYWKYGYSNRSHFASLSLDNSIGGFYGHLELSMGLGMVSSDDASTAKSIKRYVEEELEKSWGGVGTQIPVDDPKADTIKVITRQANYKRDFVFNFPTTANSDCNMPRRAYLDYSADTFSLGFYKAQKSWGFNKGGNFIFDTHNDFYNYISLKTFAKKFAFEYTLMFPENYRGGVNASAKNYEDYTRVFAAHRIEFRPIDSLNISMSENVMYRFYGFPDITLLNPATFYHNNLNNNQFNAIAHVELEYSAIKGLLIYGQFTLDQGSFPFFEDPTKEDQAMGYSLGLEYKTFVGKGVLSTSIEGIYTNPALYRPTGSSDFIINYNYLNPDDYYRFPFYTYIGYKNGGDTIAVRGDCNYRTNGLYVYSVLEVVLDGAYTMFDEYSAPIMLTAPSGDYDVITTVNLGCEYSFSWGSAPVKAFIDLTGINSTRRGFDLQVSLGTSVSYSLLLM